MKDGVLDERREGEKPYLAIGWRFLKANGKYRYVWLLKGSFHKRKKKAKRRRINRTSKQRNSKVHSLSVILTIGPNLRQMPMSLHLQKLWEIIGSKGI